MRYEGTGLACAGVFCLAAHYGGWLGVGVLLLGIAAGIRLRAWFRGPFTKTDTAEQAQVRAERIGREVGAKLAGELSVAINRAAQAAMGTKEKGH